MTHMLFYNYYRGEEEVEEMEEEPQAAATLLFSNLCCFHTELYTMFRIFLHIQITLFNNFHI